MTAVGGKKGRKKSRSGTGLKAEISRCVAGHEICMLPFLNPFLCATPPWRYPFFIFRQPPLPRTEEESPKPHRFNANSFYDSREVEAVQAGSIYSEMYSHPKVLRLKKIDTGIKHKILLFYYARCGLFSISACFTLGTVHVPFVTQYFSTASRNGLVAMGE